MPFARPTLTDLRNQVASDINAALPGVDARLRYSNLGILADALAALANGHFGYLDWIRDMSVPFSATDEYLEGWAGLKGVTRKAATVAVGTVTFTGTDGAAVPSGTPMTRADGIEFVTTADGTIASGTATVAAQAVNAGLSGNTDTGVSMLLTLGISGVNPTGTVAAAFIGGTEVESNFALRSRMMVAYSSPPQGGSYNDYAEWALAVPGVTRVWVQNAATPGSINVYFMMDDAEAAHGGFPQGTDGVASLETRDTTAAGDQLTLANALFTLQPVHVIVYALAPSPNTIDLTLTNMGSASAAVKTATEAAIAAALRFGAVPGGNTDLSEIEYAVAQVAGTDGFVITAMTCSAGTLAPSGVGNITSNAGHIPVLGTVTFS